MRSEQTLARRGTASRGCRCDKGEEARRPALDDRIRREKAARERPLRDSVVFSQASVPVRAGVRDERGVSRPALLQMTMQKASASLPGRGRGSPFGLGLACQVRWPAAPDLPLLTWSQGSLRLLGAEHGVAAAPGEIAAAIKGSFKDA